MARRGDDHVVFGPSQVVRPFTFIYRGRFANGMANGNAPHYHPDTIEVCYVAHGRLDWWLDDEALEMRSGDVLVVPPGVPHGSVDSTLQPCEFFVVHLAPEALAPATSEIAQRLRGRFASRPELGEAVRAIFEGHERGGAQWPEIGPALAILLVAALDRATEDERQGRGNFLIRRAQVLLEGSDGLGLSVGETAKRLGVSSVWLTRLFLEELGEAPGEWVRSRRFAEAKRLLALRRMSITEIAMRLGYSSSHYFASAFRHQCGMTPSAYRAICAARLPARETPPLRASMR